MGMVENMLDRTGPGAAGAFRSARFLNCVCSCEIGTLASLQRKVELALKRKGLGYWECWRGLVLLVR
ncbi:unnamed protein product [Boreogadus saida]